MHNCLGILEVIEQICYSLAEQDLLYMALTRKHFRGIALGVLWRELRSLSMFIKLFPQEIWKETQFTMGQRKSASIVSQLCLVAEELLIVHESLRRPIISADWKSVLPYLPFIRKIEADLSLTLADELLRSITFSFPGLLIFPNLRYLAQHFCTSSTLAFIKLCSSPTLEHLRLTFHSRCTDDAKASFISALGEMCPGLKTFSREHIEPDSPSCKAAVSHAVQQWRSLRSLDVSCLSHEAMVHISQLPNLTCLILYGDKFAPIPAFPDVPSPAFPAIRSLELHDATASYISAFHQAITSPTYITFYGCLRNPCPSSDWFSFFIQLGKMTCQLESITLEDEEFDEELSANITETKAARYVITSDIMRPLLSLSSLRHLDMDSVFTFSLCDDFIEELALACPNLVMVRLGTGHVAEGRSRLTLKSYLHLIQHCPNVINIGLTIDATQPTLPVSHPQGPERMGADLIISVGDSAIRDEVAVATFLLNFVVRPHQFKQLTIAACENCDEGIGYLWERVAEIVSNST